MAKSTNAKPKNIETEIGKTTEIFYKGVSPNTDYNKTLVGRGRIREYDKMRLGDSTVRACFRVISLPIIRATWFFKEASESPLDVEVKDFIQANLFKGMSRTFAEFLIEALVYLVHGNAIFEQVYEFSEDGKIRLKKLARRPSDTIHSYELSNGELGVIQKTAGGGTYEIPISKLLILVNEREGDNWEGISIFRAAYRNYFIKDKLLTIDAIAAERQGLGVPFAELTPGTKKNNPALWEETKELLQNARANENAYMLYEKGTTVGFLDMKATTTRDITKSIAMHNREITKSVLADFMELGATASGSYALSQDKTEMFLQSLEAVAEYVASCINEYVVKRLVDLNFNVKAYPTLEFSGIRKEDLAKISTAIATLLNSKAIERDDDLEAHVRDQFGLPEKNPDESTEDEDVEAHDHEDGIKGKEEEILTLIKQTKEAIDLKLDEDDQTAIIEHKL